MSLASNPWPASFETDEGPRRAQHEMSNKRPHPPRYRPVRSDQNFGISRSTSHDTGWSQTNQNVGRVAPTVGVVQPLNAVRPLPTQTVSDPYVQKQNSRRNIPPHVPPRNDMAPVIATLPPTTERFPDQIKEQIHQKENIKPASDPWKCTPEQKKYYIDEFEKLPKVQEYIEGYLCSFIEGSVAKDFFLKSKLPNEELIHIWELSDIDRDGRLTKLEFSLAFHFTSARRNNFPLPEQIPNQLYNDLIENDYIEQPDNKDDENWETFSEKSFSTVSSASTLPKFATTMTNKTEIFQPVPMRMTPSSLAARTSSSHPYKDETHGENTIESKRRMYLNLDRTPADGSSSAQSSSSSSPVSDQSIGMNESHSNLSYSSSKPLKSSSGESSESDDEQTSQKGNFADFQSLQKLIKNDENSADDPSIRSSISSGSQHNLEQETPEVPSEPKLLSTDVMSGSVTSQVSAENQRDREIEQVRSMVMSLRERNVRLTRLNMALSIELKDIISERVLLEARNDE